MITKLSEYNKCSCPYGCPKCMPMNVKKFICPAQFKSLLFENLVEQKSRAMMYSSEEEGCDFKVVFDNDPDTTYHVMDEKTSGWKL